MQKRRFPWFEILIIVLTLAIQGYAALSDAHNFPNIWFTRDDAYYYFKVAQNVSMGLGSTFDGINLTNGYHPLWMLICVPIFALARFDLILPLRILLVFLALMRAVTAILLYRLLDKTLTRPIAMLAAVYWAFDYGIHITIYQQGLETGLAAFALILFLYFLQRFEQDRKAAPVKWNQVVPLGFAAALVLFSRLDMVFLGAIFGLWIVFRDTPLRYLLPVDILLLTISVFASYISRTGLPAYYQYSSAAILTLILSLAIKLPALFFSGSYQHPAKQSPLRTLRNAAIAIVISQVLVLGFMLGLSQFNLFTEGFPRSAILFDGLVSFILIIASRFSLRWFSNTNGKVTNPPLKQFLANWRAWLTDGLAYYLPFGGLLGIYMLWSKIIFGTSSPVSGQVKRWWGSFPINVYGGSARSPLEFFGIAPETDFNAWQFVTNFISNLNNKIERHAIQMTYDASFTLFLVIFLLILYFLLHLNRSRTVRAALWLGLIPLLAGSVVQVISYNATGYSALKEWYWVSEIVLTVLMGSLVLDIILKPLRKFQIGKNLIWLAVAVVGLSTIFTFSKNIISQMPYGISDPDEPYMDIVAFVEQHTPPDSIVGMTGGGNVGYYIADRTIVNMDGLINSYDYFLAHKAGHGGAYLANIGLEYVFANPSFLDAQPYKDEYTGQLEIIDYFGGKAIMKFEPKVSQ